MSFAELDYKARQVAAGLQRKLKPGDRAVLLYPSGLEYLTAFMGCLYANVIAVPLYPPRTRKAGMQRLVTVVENATPSAFLTTQSLKETKYSAFAQHESLADIEIITSESLERVKVEDWTAPVISPDDIAFLQYSSGSTGTPKGVMVSHGNLVTNLKQIGVRYKTEEEIYVGWLPLYHDMGLIGNALSPVYAGSPFIFMSPSHFLQKPLRWLKAIEKYRATLSGGPNFAYELCLEKIPEETRKQLDLSSWTTAFNGAEPIRAGTMKRFAEGFACAGLDLKSLSPCYGLAEATLFVSGNKHDGAYITAFDKEALKESKLQLSEPGAKGSIELVGSGRKADNLDVMIVNPETRRRSNAQEVGEIWVRGENVAKGYWQQQEASREAFHAYTLDTGDGPFLRTGDLGFFHEEQLYVTGRLKDLIIIRGRNHYPQDIERTAEKSHASINPNGCGAFTIDVHGGEDLVIIAEMERRFLTQKPGPDVSEEAHKLTCETQAREVIDAINEAIAENHGVRPYAVVLIKWGTLPRTTSGKIRRRACQTEFIEGSLTVLGRYSAEDDNATDSETSQSETTSETFTTVAEETVRDPAFTERVRQRLTDLIKRHCDEENIDPKMGLEQLGLDSIALTELQGRIEEVFNLTLTQEDFLEHSDLDSLSSLVIDRLSNDDPERIEEIPGWGSYKTKSWRRRVEWVGEFCKKPLDEISDTRLKPESVRGNTENYVGCIHVPMGVAGPLLINGEHARGKTLVPLATTEGALIASVTRGCKTITMAGGAGARVHYQRMCRAPMFTFENVNAALHFRGWLMYHFNRIKIEAEAVSNHAQLVDLKPTLFGNNVNVTFVYTTGDAAGQNMTTACTLNACQWIMDEYNLINQDSRILNYYIEGGLSGDKKVTTLNYHEGRGIGVSAEAFIPNHLLKRNLKVNADEVVAVLENARAASTRAGMIGFNINIANTIAAIFTATGQDIACVHESSVGQYHVEKTDGGLLYSIFLPSLIVGTVGGGTGLPTQREALNLIDCSGADKVFRLAEIVATACLALEMSTSSAIVGGQFAAAHERFGRKRPARTTVSSHKGRRLDVVFKQILNGHYERNAQDGKAFEIKPVQFDFGNSILSELVNDRSKSRVGLFVFEVNAGTEADPDQFKVLLKSKAMDYRVIQANQRVAKLCNKQLGELHDRHKWLTGLKNCHIRELELAQYDNPTLRRITPGCYGVFQNDDNEEYVIAMEYLDGVTLKDTEEWPNRWQQQHIHAVLRDLAELHGHFMDNFEDIQTKCKLETFSGKNMETMSDLWHEIVKHNHYDLPHLYNEERTADLRAYIQKLNHFGKLMEEAPRTVIQNDCNTRNLCLRPEGDDFRLCLYDWELACINVPQRDVCEFLAYIMEPDTSFEVYKGYVDYYREQLERVMGKAYPKFWRVYHAACVEFSLNRLNMMSALHSIREYEFLPRIIHAHLDFTAEVEKQCF